MFGLTIVFLASESEACLLAFPIMNKQTCHMCIWARITFLILELFLEWQQKSQKLSSKLLIEYHKPGPYLHNTFRNFLLKKPYTQNK